MITLRPYQQTAIESVRETFRRGVKRSLLVMPTGSGKTVCFSYLASVVSSRGKRVMLVAHRDELIDQISRTLHDFGVGHSYIAAGRPCDPNHPVQVASVQTLVRRLDRHPAPDLLILDEAHRCISATTWGRVVNHYADSYVLGVTATPCRLSGEGLGDLFQEMILGPSVRELIDLGALCDYRAFMPSQLDMSDMHIRGGDYVREEAAAKMDKQTITGDAVAHYRKLSHQKPAIAFCVRVDHAEHVAEQFRDGGYSAVSIDGSMRKTGEVKRIVQDFSRRDGSVQILVSCDLVSEGFDVPGIETAILLRPTQSESLCLQQVGRALRTAPGKEYATILDHCGNLMQHGLPDDDREWTLESTKRSKKEKSDDHVNVKVCKFCFAAMRSTQMVCKSCGNEVPTKQRVVNEQEGELVEVDKEKLRAEARRRQGMAKTLDELVAEGRRREYKNPYGWAKHIIAAREGKR